MVKYKGVNFEENSQHCYCVVNYTVAIFHVNLISVLQLQYQRNFEKQV